MLGTYGLDDEEALLDALAKRRLADQRGIPDGTVGPEAAPPMEFPEMDLAAEDPLAKLPALTPMPARVDLTSARAADRQQGMRRGFETAARQAIGGLTLTKPADTITPEGTAEQTALADEARTRGDVLETRRGQMLDRQKALAALLRPPAKAPAVKPPPNPELEASVIRKNNATAAKLERPPVPRVSRAPRPGSAGSPDGKTLPASEVSSLSELPVAEDQVNKLVETFGRLGMGGISGRASGAVTDIMGLRFTDAAEYNAAAKLAMQAAGKIMEGGKLAAGDEAKYAAMLPRPGDAPAVVQQKAEGLKAFLRDLAGRRATAFKESGYNVAPSLMPSAAAPAAARNAEAEKALEWANANPDDPRAAAIKAKLGVK
jgi:hypothetical protein